MFTFDVATATCLIGFLSIMIAGSFRAFKLRSLDGSAGGQWAIAALLGGAAALLTTFGPRLPAVATLVLDNALSVAGLVFIHRGTAVFTATRPPDRGYLGLLAVAVAGFAWFGLVQPWLEARIALVSLARIICFGATLMLLARPGLPRGTRHLILILFLALSWSALRLAWALSAAPGATQFLQTGAAGAVMVAIGGIFNVLVIAFQFRLENERTRDDLARRASRLSAQREALHAQVQERTAELARLANTDSLTGLANRRHFMQYGTAEVNRARRYSQPLAMLLLDIDHFKQINDTYGHPAGDKVIEAVADVCRANGRSSDLVGRIGGEEFAMLLPEAGSVAAQLAAERLRRMVAALDFAAHGLSCAVTASIGVAVLQSSEATLDALLARADQALYLAKHTGRNRVAST